MYPSDKKPFLTPTKVYWILTTLAAVVLLIFVVSVVRACNATMQAKEERQRLAEMYKLSDPIAVPSNAMSQVYPNQGPMVVAVPQAAPSNNGSVLQDMMLYHWLFGGNSGTNHTTRNNYYYDRGTSSEPIAPAPSRSFADVPKPYKSAGSFTAKPAATTSAFKSSGSFGSTSRSTGTGFKSSGSFGGSSRSFGGGSGGFRSGGSFSGRSGK